jgi:hypothetical protein
VHQVGTLIDLDQSPFYGNDIVCSNLNFTGFFFRGGFFKILLIY